MAITRNYKIGDELPPLTACRCSAVTWPGSTVASGRMSLTFSIEMLRRFFGADVYNARGMVDLRFLRPVRPGDSVTFTGKITGTEKEADGVRVSVEVTGTNQKGAVTAAGSGACVVPSGYLPPEE